MKAPARAALFAGLLLAATNTGAAKAAPDSSALAEQAAEYYSLAMDRQGDEILARLMLHGQFEGLEGFGWAWIHSGPGGFLEERMDAIGALMRAHRGEVSAQEWEALRPQMCDPKTPCVLDEPPATSIDAVADAARLLATKAEGHRLLLVGEHHGTREAPRFMAALTEHYAQQGPVLLVLELSRSIDPALQRFMASDGGLQARKQLLADPYWHLPPAHSDGRRNYEVINLVDHLRELRGQGRQVSVMAMDVAVGVTSDSEARDQAMAERIREAFAALPDNATMLVLSGNAHAMKAKPQFAPPEMQTPMGSYLLDLDPYSALLMAGDGVAWSCIDGECGPHVVDKQWVESGPDGSKSYDFRIALPRYTTARMIQEK